MPFDYVFILGCVFVLGTVVGSWLNVCVHRLSREERVWLALRSLVYPPSHCPRCKSAIAWFDNVPMFGWLWLRGRCRNCRGKISPRYPLVELATGLLFALLYFCEIPPEWDPHGGTLQHIYGPATLFTPSLTVVHVRFASHLVLLCALIVATLIDFDLRIIPDSVTLPAMLAAVVFQTAFGTVFLVPVWYQTVEMGDIFRMFAVPFVDPTESSGWLVELGRFVGPTLWVESAPRLHGLAVSLAGLLLGGGVIWGVRLVGGWMLKQEAMGFGDVVLMAMIGAFVGWQGTIAVFMLAPLLAVVGTLVPMIFWKTRTIPFGPYLSLATLVLLVGFDRLWPTMENGILALGVLLPLVAVAMLVSLAGMLGVWGYLKLRIGWGEDTPAVEFVSEWLPGDQLAYLAMENHDDRQGQWRGETWPGRLAGRGQSHLDAWKNQGKR